MRQAKTMALAGLMSTGLVVPIVQMQGCGVLQPFTEPGVTPSVTEYLDLIDATKQSVEKERDAALARCEGDPACKQKVNEKFDKIQEDLTALKQKILEEGWEDARDYLKKLREKYKDLVDLVDILKKISDKVLERTVGTAEGQATVGATTRRTTVQPNQDASLRYTKQYNAALNATTTSSSVAIQGSFDVACAQGGPGGPGVGTWPVQGGSFTFTNPLGASETVKIVDDTLSSIPSQLVIRPDGTGELQLVLDMGQSSEPRATQANWFMVNPHPIRFPVRVLANGTLQVQGTGAQLFKPDIWPASDYDGNGKLSLENDLPAFLMGFEAQERLADSNFDGEFNDTDVELWMKRFEADRANQ